MLSFPEDFVVQKFVLYHVIPFGSLNAAVSSNTTISLLWQSYLRWLLGPIISETHIGLNARQRLESVLQTWITCQVATQTFFQFGSESSLWEVKRQGREADTRFPSVPRLRMMSYTSPHFHDVCGDNFSLLFLAINVNFCVTCSVTFMLFLALYWMFYVK